MPRLYVSLLPSLMDDVPMAECTAVVIDILRASTTIIHALANGAETVIPCREISQALETAEQFPPTQRLLGGERKGELIPGFDLDNSPFAYSPERVTGKTVIFTTTNGTKALDCSRAAHAIFIGAFVNESALVDRLKHADRDVALVCAGTDGKLTAEDLLFAGSVLNRLREDTASGWELGNIQAQVVDDYYQARGRTSDAFRETFLDSLGARNLTRLGMTADIERAMERDLFNIVPIWNEERQVLNGD